MAARPDGDEPERRGWWHTAPGILTGVAGVLTAIAGLLVALQQVGLLGVRASSGEAPAPSETVSSEQPSARGVGSGPSLASAPAASYRLGLSAGSRVVLRSSRGEGTYDILSTEVTRKDANRLDLSVTVRLTNAGPLDLGFWSDSFRLFVDGVPRAPVNSLIEAVDARSAEEAVIHFEVPSAVSDLVLEIANGEDSGTLPLLLERLN